MNTLRADRAEDLARIHIEAIGGRERIAALEALRATGKVSFPGGKQVSFTLLAARPARVRIETQLAGRTLVQASDGREPPWEFDTGAWPPVYRAMSEATAKTFLADAEFDDPFVAGKAGGYSFDFAGEIEHEGSPLQRVLVTRKFTETFSVAVDPDTYFIVMRIDERLSASGRKVPVITYYDDFRPVQGVLLPHQITVAIDGHIAQQTKVAKIDPNPKLTAETFVRPKASSATATAP